MPSYRSRQIKWAVQGALAACCAAGSVIAQEAPAPAAQQTQLQEVTVTGSRIQQSIAEQTQPLSIINSAQIDRTGLESVGEILNQLPTMGAALNTKFNSSGNFGYPPDGGGIGAGSAQVDMRNLDCKRTLVMVDGLRWVNESSASGVSGCADLNTIPLSIVDHIEVLEDGASAIYGSDAIAGVVNIITKKKLNGVEVTGYTGEYSKGGRTTQGDLTIGGSTDTFSAVFIASYYKQEEISSSKWWQSSEPVPRMGIASGSSATSQGRATFCDPAVPGSCTPDQSNFYDVALNNGTTTPVWDPNNPTSPPSTYHAFGAADRFNFAPLNLLLTPSERKSIWTSVSYAPTDDLELYAKGMFNNRTSTNEAAPEPIFVGPYAGTGGIADTIDVSRLNPYNPYGIDLCSVAQAANSSVCPGGPNFVQNFGWITRRPIEAGPRIFNQDVNTWYFSTGFRGLLHWGDGFAWDLNFSDSDNKASQSFTGGYNIAKVGIALGDPAVCAQVPGCVPLDLFGGQGRQITPAMLNYILAPQIDSSEQPAQTGVLQHHGSDFPHPGPRRWPRGRCRVPQVRRHLYPRSAAPGRGITGFLRGPGVAELPRERGLRRTQSAAAQHPRGERRRTLFGLLDLRQSDHLQGRHPLAAHPRLCAAWGIFDGFQGAEPRRALWPDAVRRHARRPLRADGQYGSGGEICRRMRRAGRAARLPAGQHPDHDVHRR